MNIPGRKPRSLGAWVEALPSQGRYSFTRSEAMAALGLKRAQLKHAEARQPPQSIRFKSQISRGFWAADRVRKFIRPDILAQIGTGPGHECIVLDTKWKIPSDGRPADSDLHQMHSYNIQFGARRSFLLYPRVSASSDIQGAFAKPEPPLDAFAHDCGMLFLDLFDGDKLRRDLGDEVIAKLLSRPPSSA